MKSITPSLHVVYTTIGSLQEAKILAEKIIALEYAACVNILPQILSIYRWNHAIHQGDECALLCKTTADKAPLLKQFIQKEHPYEVASILETSLQTTPDFFKYVEENSHA